VTFSQYLKALEIARGKNAVSKCIWQFLTAPSVTEKGLTANLTTVLRRYPLLTQLSSCGTKESATNGILKLELTRKACPLRQSAAGKRTRDSPAIISANR
jgi:hypothetical protein